MRSFIYCVIIPPDRGNGSTVETFTDQQVASDFARPFGGTVLISEVDRVAESVRPEATIREFADAVQAHMREKLIEVRGVAEALKIVAIYVHNNSRIEVEMDNGQRFYLTVEELSRV